MGRAEKPSVIELTVACPDHVEPNAESSMCEVYDVETNLLYVFPGYVVRYHAATDSDLHVTYSSQGWPIDRYTQDNPGHRVLSSHVRLALP